MPTLFHSAFDLRCQAARLVLAEKGVAHRSVRVDPGFPFDAAGAWYADISRDLDQPAFRMSGDVRVGALAIASHVDAAFPGPALQPADEAERRVMEAWAAELSTLPDREIELGLRRGLSDRLRRLRAAARLAALKRRLRGDAAKNVKLICWAARESALQRRARDPGTTQAQLRDVGALVDRFDAHIAGRDFVAGDRWSIADAAWTAILARLKLLGLRELFDPARRPHATAYFRRMKLRPSFDAAFVFEQRPSAFDMLTGDRRARFALGLALSPSRPTSPSLNPGGDAAPRTDARNASHGASS